MYETSSSCMGVYTNAQIIEMVANMGVAREINNYVNSSAKY